MPTYGVEIHGIQLPNNAPLVLEIRDIDPSGNGLTPGRLWYNSTDESLKYVFRSKEDLMLHIATIPNDLPSVIDIINNTLTSLEDRISTNETDIDAINKHLEDIDSFINVTLPSFSGTDYIGGNTYTSENGKVSISTGTLTDILHQIVEKLSTIKISEIVFDQTIKLPDDVTIQVTKKPEDLNDVVNKKYIDDLVYNLMYRLYGLRAFVREVIDVENDIHTIAHRLKSKFVHTTILVLHDDDNRYWQDQVNVRIDDENTISFKCGHQFIMIVMAFGATEYAPILPQSDSISQYGTR